MDERDKWQPPTWMFTPLTELRDPSGEVVGYEYEPRPGEHLSMRRQFPFPLRNPIEVSVSRMHHPGRGDMTVYTYRMVVARTPTGDLGYKVSEVQESVIASR